MAILARVDQKIFGSTGDPANFGQIGSQTAGTPANTKDLATIQALAGYLAGLQAITNSSTPYLEDMNSLYLLITSQIKYLFQNGIPEYSATEPYYNLISFVQVNGVLYQSIDGTSGAPNTGNAPASSPTKWRNIDPYTLGQSLDAEVSRAEAAEAGLASDIAAETARAEAAEAAISGASGLSYVQTAVEEAGFTWDPTDTYLLSKAEIAMSHVVGEDIFMNQVLTQVIFSAARSTANPAYPQYLPVIERNVDKVITSTMAPPLVTALRAMQTTVLGTTNFSGTVGGSNIVFANLTINNQMLTMLINEALVRQWFVSQDANFSTTGILPSGGPAPMTINVNGTDYVITGINFGTRTITVSGTPTSGIQTCILYPYRIAGSATSIQLPRLSGFVPVASGDADATVNDGYRIMDTTQDHYHSTNTQVLSGVAGSGISGALSSGGAQPLLVLGMSAGSIGGTPRPAKNTSPRTNSRRVYTWAGALFAAG